MRDYFDNNDVTERNLKYLMEKHGEIYEAYENFGRTLHEKGGPIEAKCRWLIKIASSASCQHKFALETHILKALHEGCSKEEIEHAILLIAPTAGFPTMMEALLTFRRVLGDEKK